MKDAIDAIPLVAKVPIVVVPSIVALYLVWFVTLGIGAKFDTLTAQVNAALSGQTKVLRALCVAQAKGDPAVLQQCIAD